MLLNRKHLINRHGNMMLPWYTFFLAAIASGLYLFAGAAPEFLVYDRSAITSGEWWRLITAHWVHSDGQHALWDIGALVILGGYSERYLGKQIFLFLLTASLLTSILIWVFIPWIEYYCGLSGILHTLLITGMYACWREQQDPVFLLIITLTVLKTLFEMTSNNAVFTNTAWPILPFSHLYGIIIGVLIVVVYLRHELFPSLK